MKSCSKSTTLFVLFEKDVCEEYNKPIRTNDKIIGGNMDFKEIGIFICIVIGVSLFFTIITSNPVVKLKEKIGNLFYRLPEVLRVMIWCFLIIMFILLLIFASVW